MQTKSITIRITFLLALLALMLVGCGRLEVGIEATQPALPTVTSTTGAITPEATPPAPASTAPASTAPASTATTPAVEPVATEMAGPPVFDKVNIFLIAIDDDGRTGQRVGCGDSAVPVERVIAPTSAPLHAALSELLSLREPLYGDTELYNALWQSQLEIASLSIENRKATVHLTGPYLLGGTCDDPRFAAQLEETVLQFATIDEVEIFIDNVPLSEIISGADPVESGGLHVAYVKDNNVWLWRERGEQTALTTAGGVEEVKISDDGRIIAFIRGGELWAVNSGGYDERRLLSADDLAAMGSGERVVVVYQFHWAPWSHTLTFNTHELFDGPGLILNNDLWSIDANTSETTLLLPAGQSGEFYYSPDGSQIAIVTPGDISLINADGRNRRQALTYAPVLTYSESPYYARPVWAADGSELMVVIPPVDPLAEPMQSATIFRLSIEGHPAQFVRNVEAISLFYGPALSSDLTSVAYLQPAGENQYDLVVGRLDGEAFLYARDVRELEGWAPDSEHFIFSHDSTVKQLGRVGMASRPLTGDATAVTDVRWVDAERFIYLNQSPRGWDIILGNIQGEQMILDAVAGFPPSFDF